MKDSKQKDIERKVYMAYFEDGLWDMVVGLFLLAWAIGVLTDTAWMAGIWFVALYMAVSGLKKRFTYPRIGYARISKEKRTILGLVIAGVIALLAGLFVFIGIGTNTATWLLDYSILILAVIFAAIISGIAFSWKVNWWYGYALVVLVSAAAHKWLGIPLWLSYAIPGTGALFGGLILLIRFLSRHPLPSNENKFSSR